MTQPDQSQMHQYDGPPSPDCGTTRAFEALVRDHYGRLCSFAFRFVGTPEAAQDVVHDVLLKVWQRRHNFEFRDPLAYLDQAVRNETISYRRRQVTRNHAVAHL